jgi:hypothetical protein
MLALVLGMACVQSAPAQTFKRVMVKGGAPLVQIAPGGASVWARASNGNPYILKGKQFVLANSISLSEIAVGGGSTFQADAVWGLDSSGRIYSARKSGTSWIFDQMPGVLDSIAVGAGHVDSCHPYEVWGLSSTLIYRYNFCVQNWDNVPGSLATLAVGGSDIWGINGNGDVFYFDFGTLSFWKWPSSWGASDQVAVGSNGVWVLSRGDIYELEYSSPYFVSVGTGLTQIRAGGNGMWGLDASGGVFFLRSWHLYFIPGVLTSISVGSGGGVWGLDSSGKAFAFSTP